MVSATMPGPCWTTAPFGIRRATLAAIARSDVIGRRGRERMRRAIGLRHDDDLFGGYRHTVGRVGQAVVEFREHGRAGVDRGAHPAHFAPEHEAARAGPQRRDQNVGTPGAGDEPGHAPEPDREGAHATLTNRNPERVAGHHRAYVGKCVDVVHVDRRGQAPAEQHAHSAHLARGVTDARADADRRAAAVGDRDAAPRVKMCVQSGCSRTGQPVHGAPLGASSTYVASASASTVVSSSAVVITACTWKRRPVVSPTWARQQQLGVDRCRASVAEGHLGGELAPRCRRVARSPSPRRRGSRGGRRAPGRAPPRSSGAEPDPAFGAVRRSRTARSRATTGWSCCSRSSSPRVAAAPRRDPSSS